MLRLGDERGMEGSIVMNECFLGLTSVRGAALIPLRPVGLYTHACVRTHRHTNTQVEVGWEHVVQSCNPVRQMLKWVFH